MNTVSAFPPRRWAVRFRRRCARHFRSAAAATTAAAVLLVITGLLDCLFTPDRENSGVRVSNRPPEVRITSGADHPQDVDYRVRFEWTASDEDGVVTGYDWALDDTVSEAACTT